MGDPDGNQMNRQIYCQIMLIALKRLLIRMNMKEVQTHGKWGQEKISIILHDGELRPEQCKDGIYGYLGEAK